MTHRQAVFVAVLVVTVLALGLPAAAAQETTTATPTNTTETTANETGTEAGLGTQLTAFLQSNSASANDTVENAMWKASFDHANESKRARLVTDRAGSLEQRLERLQARNETLRDRYESGSLSRQAYIAQQSRLAAQIDGLQAAVEDTDDAATQAGVSDAALDRLKTEAGQLRGPQVAEIARGLGGGPPAGPPDRRGPPEGVGGPATENPEPNETAGPGHSGTGDGNADAPAGNGTDGTNEAGASAGNGNGSGNGSGPSDTNNAENGNSDSSNANGNGNSAGSGDSGPPSDGDNSGPPSDNGGSGPPNDSQGGGNSDRGTHSSLSIVAELARSFDMIVYSIDTAAIR